MAAKHFVRHALCPLLQTFSPGTSQSMRSATKKHMHLLHCSLLQPLPHNLSHCAGAHCLCHALPPPPSAFSSPFTTCAAPLGRTFYSPIILSAAVCVACLIYSASSPHLLTFTTTIVENTFEGQGGLGGTGWGRTDAPFKLLPPLPPSL